MSFSSLDKEIHKIILGENGKGRSMKVEILKKELTEKGVEFSNLYLNSFRLKSNPYYDFDLGTESIILNEKGVTTYSSETGIEVDGFCAKTKKKEPTSESTNKKNSPELEVGGKGPVRPPKRPSRKSKDGKTNPMRPTIPHRTKKSEVEKYWKANNIPWKSYQDICLKISIVLHPEERNRTYSCQASMDRQLLWKFHFEGKWDRKSYGGFSKFLHHCPYFDFAYLTQKGGNQKKEHVKLNNVGKKQLLFPLKSCYDLCINTWGVVLSFLDFWRVWSFADSKSESGGCNLFGKICKVYIQRTKLIKSEEFRRIIGRCSGNITIPLKLLRWGRVDLSDDFDGKILDWCNKNPHLGKVEEFVRFSLKRGAICLEKHLFYGIKESNEWDEGFSTEFPNLSIKKEITRSMNNLETSTAKNINLKKNKHLFFRKLFRKLHKKVLLYSRKKKEEDDEEKLYFKEVFKQSFIDQTRTKINPLEIWKDITTHEILSQEKFYDGNIKIWDLFEESLLKPKSDNRVIVLVDMLVIYLRRVSNKYKDESKPTLDFLEQNLLNSASSNEEEMMILWDELTKIIFECLARKESPVETEHIKRTSWSSLVFLKRFVKNILQLQPQNSEQKDDQTNHQKKESNNEEEEEEEKEKEEEEEEEEEGKGNMKYVNNKKIEMIRTLLEDYHVLMGEVTELSLLFSVHEAFVEFLWSFSFMKRSAGDVYRILNCCVILLRTKESQILTKIATEIFDHKKKEEEEEVEISKIPQLDDEFKKDLFWRCLQHENLFQICTSMIEKEFFIPGVEILGQALDLIFNTKIPECQQQETLKIKKIGEFVKFMMMKEKDDDDENIVLEIKDDNTVLRICEDWDEDLILFLIKTKSQDVTWIQRFFYGCCGRESSNTWLSDGTGVLISRLLIKILHLYKSELNPLFDDQKCLVRCLEKRLSQNFRVLVKYILLLHEQQGGETTQKLDLGMSEGYFLKKSMEMGDWMNVEFLLFGIADENENPTFDKYALLKKCVDELNRPLLSIFIKNCEKIDLGWNDQYCLRTVVSKCDKGKAGEGYQIILMLMSKKIKEKIDPSVHDQYCVRKAVELGNCYVLEKLLSDERVDPSVMNQICLRNACRKEDDCMCALLAHPKVDASFLMTEPEFAKNFYLSRSGIKMVYENLKRNKFGKKKKKKIEVEEEEEHEGEDIMEENKEEKKESMKGGEESHGKSEEEGIPKEGEEEEEEEQKDDKVVQVKEEKEKEEGEEEEKEKEKENTNEKKDEEILEIDDSEVRKEERKDDKVKEEEEEKKEKEEVSSSTEKEDAVNEEIDDDSEEEEEGVKLEDVEKRFLDPSSSIIRTYEQKVDPDLETVIINCGSYATRLGFSSEDGPKITFPTLVGRPKSQTVWLNTSGCFIGDDAASKRGILSMSPVFQNGYISNFNDWEKIIHHSFYNELRVTPEEHPVIITEPPLNPKYIREKMVSILFETFNVPALYIINEAVLSLFGCARDSGIVIDCGHDSTFSVPVHEGNALDWATHSLFLGGNDINGEIVKILGENGFDITECSTDSREVILRDIKEKHGYVAEDYHEELVKPLIEKEYILPDLRSLYIKDERFRAPEILFNPQLVGLENIGVDEMCYNSIQKCNVDHRKDMYQSIVLSGGSSMFEGFGERLKKEVVKMAPRNARVKVHSSVSNNKDLSFLGAGILTSMASFCERWVAKADYDQYGATVMHRVFL